MKGGVNNFKLGDNIYYSSNIFFITRMSENIIDNDGVNFDVGEILKKTLKEILSTNFILHKKTKGYSKDVITTEEAIEKMRFTDKYIGYKNNNNNPEICINVITLGLVYNKILDLDLLIEKSIYTGKLTHYNNIGLLSAITASYFISLAVRSEPINKWVDMMLELINSEKVKNYLDLDENENMIAYVTYLNYWNRYRDSRFIDNKIRKTRSDDNLTYRAKFYNQFSIDKGGLLGSDCISCLIISYDSLLTCDGNFEKLIFYSLLIPGPTITIGGYGGGLYGLIYGDENISPFLLNQLIDIDDLKILGKKMNKI
jgi:ADP-ribosylglycohydrolase